MNRTIIVGDVHGCREELDALLDRVAFATGDRLVFVGDLVARGPDSLGVLDIARRTGAIIVRGNHEEKLLSWHAAQSSQGEGRGRKGRERRREAEGLSRMHLDIAESLRAVDWTLLQTSPLYCELPEHGACVVHAGLLPGVPLEEQDWSTLLHIRSLTPKGEATEAKGDRLWGRYYGGGPHIVFGHNAMMEPQLHRWATGIDTGCVYGGRLTAMVLHDGDVVPRGRGAEELLVHQPARDGTRKKKVA